MQERPAYLLVIHISAKQIKTSIERYRVESMKPSALLEVIGRPLTLTTHCLL